MTGYDEQVVKCGNCNQEMLICHYGFHPAFSILCPDCTSKVPKLVESLKNKQQNSTEVDRK